MGQGRCRGGDGGRLGIRLPFGDRGGRRRSLLGGAVAGGGHRRHPGGARAAAGVGLVGCRAARRHPAVRRNRAHRLRHRTGLRHQRDREDGGGRGAPLPGPARRRGGRRRMPAPGRLVLPEQPRHPGRRPRRGPGRAATPSRRRRPVAGRGGGSAARHGGSALPARRAGGRGPRGRRGRGRTARVPAPCPDSGVSARETAARARRCRPRGRRPPRPRGCRLPAGPGWNSRAP